MQQRIRKDEEFALHHGVRQFKLTLEWAKHRRIVAYSIFRYDYKARLIDSSRSENWKAIDDFFTMESNGLTQRINVDLTKADDTHAFVITIDGFENFNTDDEVMIQCHDTTDYSDFGKLFEMSPKMFSTYKGLCICICYIDGVFYDSRSRWIMKSLERPMFAYSIPEQESFCSQLVVYIVPSFERFRYHLFPNVRCVCAALSSQSLPKLKEKFLRYPDGVTKDLFTELIFHNLFENHPKIVDPDEAAYSVALIHELFDSIDYSGDELVSWEEFTSYVISTIVGLMQNESNEIEEYIVEYEEDVTKRDHVLSAHIPVQSMKFIPDTKLILVVPVQSEIIFVFYAKNFHLRSKIDPSQIVVNIIQEDNVPERKKDKKVIAYIYDVVYLTGKDYYCFSSNDNSITIVKEV